jgi:RNA polymerase sigma-70 factor (ECF subfamily)
MEAVMGTEETNPVAPQDFETVAFDHMDALFRTAKALLRNKEEAEDAVQETYLQAWKSFHRFTPGTNCRAWMFAILFNVVRHHRRKWLDRFRFGLPEGFEQTAAAPQSVPEDLTDEEILAALQQIPGQHAEVVLLADVQELSYKEIQEVLGIPIGTVMSRLSRGRQMLRSRLSVAAAGIGIKTAASGRAYVP